MYNFDKIIKRSHTSSIKWDPEVLLTTFGTEDSLPLWIADMDFEAAPAIKKAMIKVAELGSMGRRESGAGDDSGENDDTKIYTDPHQAKVFVEETGIDALACSFGTTHGIYLTQPKLDFDVVKNVRALTEQIPIVMHGGSGVSREDYRKAIEAGTRKVNYFTYMDKSGGEEVCQQQGRADKCRYAHRQGMPCC